MLRVPSHDIYFLHRCGHQSKDQIWIEYNDFLMQLDDEEIIRTKMIETIFYKLGKYNSLVVGASNPKNFKHIENLGMKKRTLWKTHNFSLDLDSLRTKKQSLMEHLSRNSRYQIMRSIRIYQSMFGEINLIKANTMEDAQEMLEFWIR